MNLKIGGILSMTIRQIQNRQKLLVLILIFAVISTAYMLLATTTAATNSKFAFNELVREDSATIFNNESELASYVRKFGPARTVQRLNELVALYGSCHNSAHKAGRFAYEIYSSGAFTLCSAECHSGCYHGATEAYFREHGTANLTGSLKLLCNSELNPFFSHQCIHGIGHGLMAWSSYEIFDALESCDLLDKMHDSCYTGVFMENIVGSLDEIGHKTKYLSGDPHFPCNAVDDKYKWSCYFYQTTRMIRLFESNFTRVSEECMKSGYQASCFASMGRDIGAANRGDPDGAISDCLNAPYGNLRTLCITGAVQDEFWDPTGQDSAIRFCKTLEDKPEKDACYNTIFYRANDIMPDNGSFEVFCAKAEPEYQGTCLKIRRI